MTQQQQQAFLIEVICPHVASSLGYTGTVVFGESEAIKWTRDAAGKVHGDYMVDVYDSGPSEFEIVAFGRVLIRATVQ